MRKVLSIFFLLVLPIASFATIDTASAGNWSSYGIWQSGTIPANGDTLVIPAGVSVDVNCNCGTYSNMHIIVFGTINFPGGRKINLSANGLVDVYSGGTVTGSNNGDKLNINGTAVWTGSQTDITGPSSCTSSGCSANPTLPVELLLFECFATERNNVIFTWSTATESNNDYFTVYGSESLDDWKPLFDHSGVGNSIDLVEYEVSYRLEGKYQYYQLEQNDLDGETKKLSIAHCDLKMSDMPVQLLSHPSVGEISLKGMHHMTSEVEIYGSAGNLLRVTSAENNERVTVSGLSAGYYVVKVMSEGDTITLKAAVL